MRAPVVALAVLGISHVPAAWAQPATGPSARAPSGLPPAALSYASPCAGEGLCAAGRWRAVRAVPVYAKRDTGAAPAFALRAGERVQGVGGWYEVAQPGLALVVRGGDVQAGRLRTGDTVFVLGDQGEGDHDVWFGGRRRDWTALTTDPAAGATAPEFRAVRSPWAVWWLEVRDARGRRGWVPLRRSPAEGRAPLDRVDGTE